MASHMGRHPKVSRDQPYWFGVIHTPKGWFVVFYEFGALEPTMGTVAHATKADAERRGIRWAAERTAQPAPVPA